MKWKIKVDKAMYVLAATVRDELLHRIRDANTHKEEGHLVRVVLKEE